MNCEIHIETINIGNYRIRFNVVIRQHKHIIYIRILQGNTLKRDDTFIWKHDLFTCPKTNFLQNQVDLYIKTIVTLFFLIEHDIDKSTIQNDFLIITNK